MRPESCAASLRGQSVSVWALDTDVSRTCIVHCWDGICIGLMKNNGRSKHCSGVFLAHLMDASAAFPLSPLPLAADHSRSTNHPAFSTSSRRSDGLVGSPHATKHKIIRPNCLLFLIKAQLWQCCIFYPVLSPMAFYIVSRISQQHC